MMTTTRCYIALGSNLQHPRQQLEQALQTMARLPETRLVDQSPFYRSAPLGPQDQPAFVNAVAALDTALPPLALLDALQQIEQRHGRTRDRRWGPRTLDLDILLYGDRLIDEPRLQIPHYHMHARAFVLYPLADIAPDLIMPDRRPLRDWLADCPFEGLNRLE